jgi:hypothetical protein
MSTITEIQEAIEKLPANEKSALAAWLQSKEEPIMSEAEEAALLARASIKPRLRSMPVKAFPSNASARKSVDGLENNFRSAGPRRTRADRSVHCARRPAGGDSIRRLLG